MKYFNNINEQALDILSDIRFMVENDNYTPEEWKNKAETDKERIERIVDYWRQLDELIGESGEYWDCGSCDFDTAEREWERFCEVFDETSKHCGTQQRIRRISLHERLLDLCFKRP